MSSSKLVLAIVPAVLLASLPAPIAAARLAPPPPLAPEPPDAANCYGRLPMAFEPNLGQTDARVRYLARGQGYTVFVADDEVVLGLAGEALRVSFVGASAPQTGAERELPGTSNYLIGQDESKWLRNVPNYAAVRWADVYEGVDAVFYGTQQQLEYDLAVAPGADPSQVRVRFEGQQSAEVDEAGELVLTMQGGEVRQLVPAVFEQRPDGDRRVAARCVLASDGEVAFDVGEYDGTRPLLIDPVLVYSDFFGGTATNTGDSIAVDSSGAAYLTGETTSTSFPTSGTAYARTYNIDRDVYVTKLSASGSTLAYSTYLGGSGEDFAEAIAVDASGAAYVTGITPDVSATGNPPASDFPTTAGAFDTTHNGGEDVFVTKLSATGTALVYSTFLGGSGGDTSRAIAVDSSGAAYVAGETSSTAYPTTAGAFDTTFNGGGDDAFVTKLSATGTALVYSTFLGGSLFDQALAIAVNASGAAFVTGGTPSTNFPVTAGAFDTTHNGSTDVFVTKLATAGNALTYSTFLGGSSNDDGMGIAVDSSGAVYVAGETASTAFPTTAGAFDTTLGRNFDAFATKLSATGSTLVYSTFLGGSAADPGSSIEAATAIAVDASGAAYVTGSTNSTTFPTTAGAFDTTFNGGGDDAFVTKLSATGTALVYSTFLGGAGDDEGTKLAVDASGAAYVIGATFSADFPTTAGVFDTTYGNGGDAFVTKLAAAGNALTYSTYLGGTGDDAANAIAVDPSGTVYLTGVTASVDFPTIFGFDPSYDGGVDAFVMRLTADGVRMFSTFLGGRVSNDVSQGIAVDGLGIYLTGYTRNVAAGTEDPADYFPTTASAAGTGGDDLFVTRLTSDGGHISYSLVLGGMDPDLGPGTTDRGYAVATRAGIAYVTGYTDSVDFPTTAGALDTTHNGSNDALALKVSTAGTLTYSTFLGGTGDDRGNAISVDASGAAYVGGETSSTAFPTTAGAFDTTYNGGPRDAFVTKVAPNGSALAYSTFLGGTDDEVCKGIALDASGAAFVTGNVNSTTYPTTPGAFDTTHNGSSDAFVTKLDATGAGLVYSTFLGGSAIDNGNAIAVDASGVAYVTGVTFSTSFPTTPGGFDTTYNGNQDAFATRLSAAGNLLQNSTFLGGSGADRGNGIAVDRMGAAYVTGQTASLDFVISGFGINDGASAFIVKLSGGGADTAGIYVASTGAWFLKNSNAGGPADLVFSFGPAAAGIVALRGDWDGDGVDSPGLYDPATGNFFLKNASAPGAADLVFSFGAGGPDVVAVTGDYDGDGVDTVGIYIRSTGAFFLKNSNAAGPADVVFSFGPGGADIEPLFGDYDGNGTDTVGIYNRTTGAWFLKNANGGGGADLVFGFGPTGTGVEPLVGDYDGDGDDTVGVYISSTGAWFLKNTNGGGAADVVFSFGPANVKPLVGDWDGV